MLEIIASLAEWLSSENILHHGGWWLLRLIEFLETGIFFGFLLPGNSLLLTAGIMYGTIYKILAFLHTYQNAHLADAGCLYSPPTSIVFSLKFPESKEPAPMGE